jgi:hypothetical protein
MSTMLDVILVKPLTFAVDEFALMGHVLGASNREEINWLFRLNRREPFTRLTSAILLDYTENTRNKASTIPAAIVI